MAALSTALTLGTAAVNAFGAISAGKSASKQADRSAFEREKAARLQAGFIEEESAAQAGFIQDTATAQAQIEREQAQRRREIAEIEEADFRRTQSRVLAARRAAMGASGVRQDTGSPILAIGDFAAETELQALRIRAAGEIEATRTEQQARLRVAAGTKQAELIRKSGQTEASILRSTGTTEAGLLRSAGGAAERRSLFRAGASLLSGASVAFS